MNTNINYNQILGMVVFVLLTGCNKEVEQVKQDAAYRQQIEDNASKERMHMRDLANRFELAAAAGALQLKMAAQKLANAVRMEEVANAFWGPLIKFLSAIGALTGITFAWKSYDTWLEKQRLIMDFRIAEIGIEHDTLRKTHEKNITFVDANLDRFKDAERMMLLGNLSRTENRLDDPSVIYSEADEAA